MSPATSPVIHAKPDALAPPPRTRDPLAPCTIVIFGVTGDLAGRKLVPALYNLFVDGALPRRLRIIGVGRGGTQDEVVTSLHTAAVAHSRRELDAAVWARFASTIVFVPGEFTADDTYAEIGRALTAGMPHESGGGNRLFYLATPPDLFEPIVEHMAAAGLITPPGGAPWTRVVIEKPIGRDLASAKAFGDAVAKSLDESQVYRIDHYLGKETVQNMLVFRFANAIFEPIWNRKYIDHVQITAAESIGIEHRGAFYDRTGVLRDIVQNHLLQVLALCTMEAPVSFRADDIRDRKIEVWRSLRPVTGADVARDTVRAQYRGYAAAPEVARDSRTPTYAALRLHIDNWRWQGVPFYLRAGKQLAARTTEVSIQFQTIPLCLFEHDEACHMAPNVLTLRIQPEEGISLRFAAKTPGDGTTVSNILMNMDYHETFHAPIVEAYERLLLDTLRGDPTLFARRDGVERAWEFITPILDAWAADTQTPLAAYEPGGQGPAEADALLAAGGHMWRTLAP
jgi:glucose-6-phosphate 1-dehydrogenase